MDNTAKQITAVRDILRRETRDIHERLHRHPHFAALFDGTLDIEGYGELICRLHGFYAPLDSAIAVVLSDMPDTANDYRHARRADLLARDITDLTGGRARTTPPPLCLEAAGLVSRASVGGVLYVIEGATLGGAQIDRVAQRLLGTDQPAGRRFWSWCRQEGGARWHAMVAFLGRLQAAGVTISDLVTGARETFRCLEDWLAPLGRAPLQRTSPVLFR